MTERDAVFAMFVTWISGIGVGAGLMFITKVWFWSDKLCGDCHEKLSRRSQ